MVVSDRCRRDAGYVLHCQDKAGSVRATDREATLGSRRGDLGALMVIEGGVQAGSDPVLSGRHRLTVMSRHPVRANS